MAKKVVSLLLASHPGPTVVVTVIVTGPRHRPRLSARSARGARPGRPARPAVDRLVQRLAGCGPRRCRASHRQAGRPRRRLRRRRARSPPSSLVAAAIVVTLPLGPGALAGARHRHRRRLGLQPRPQSDGVLVGAVRRLASACCPPSRRSARSIPPSRSGGSTPRAPCSASPHTSRTCSPTSTTTRGPGSAGCPHRLGARVSGLLAFAALALATLLITFGPGLPVRPAADRRAGHRTGRGGHRRRAAAAAQPDPAADAAHHDLRDRRRGDARARGSVRDGLNLRRRGLVVPDADRRHDAADEQQGCRRDHRAVQPASSSVPPMIMPAAAIARRPAMRDTALLTADPIPACSGWMAPEDRAGQRGHRDREADPEQQNGRKQCRPVVHGVADHQQPGEARPRR